MAVLVGMLQVNVVILGYRGGHRENGRAPRGERNYLGQRQAYLLGRVVRGKQG